MGARIVHDDDVAGFKHRHELLLDIHRVEPATIILVTHVVDEALYLADRIVLLGRDHGPGHDGAGNGGPDGDGRHRAATIRRIETVPGDRPRDRADPRLAALRRSLLESLGVTAAK